VILVVNTTLNKSSTVSDLIFFIYDIGPNNWASQYHMCGWEKQSPIDITTLELMRDVALNDIKFNNYDKHFEHFSMKNNGHGGQLL